MVDFPTKWDRHLLTFICCSTTDLSPNPPAQITFQGRVRVSSVTNHLVPLMNIRSVFTDLTKTWCESCGGKKTSLMNSVAQEVTVSLKTNLEVVTAPDTASVKESAASLKPTDRASRQIISAEEITPKLQRSEYYTEPSISALS